MTSFTLEKLNDSNNSFNGELLAQNFQSALKKTQRISKHTDYPIILYNSKKTNSVIFKQGKLIK